MLASVFIFIPFRQNKEEGLSDRDGSTAFWAIELRGLKFIKISLISGWRPSLHRDEVKRSFLHDENPWISTMDYDTDQVSGVMEYWDIGVVEWWAYKQHRLSGSWCPLLQYSGTPSLRLPNIICLSIQGKPLKTKRRRNHESQTH
jgi:hypothetical protein